MAGSELVSDTLGHGLEIEQSQLETNRLTIDMTGTDLVFDGAEMAWNTKHCIARRRETLDAYGRDRLRKCGCRDDPGKKISPSGTEKNFLWLVKASQLAFDSLERAWETMSPSCIVSELTEKSLLNAYDSTSAEKCHGRDNLGKNVALSEEKRVH